MAKKKKRARKSPSQKGGNKSFAVIFIVVIITALLAFAITYIVMNTEDMSEVTEQATTSGERKKVNPKNEETKKISNEGPTIEKANINGTWVSENDGAMLTIKGRDYTIELPNVDGTIVGSGTIVALKHQVTFVNTSEDSDCTVSPGVYKYELGDNTITFQKVDDKCKSRVNRLTSTWFKI